MAVAPSQQEIEDHNVNHLPFRSWCKHCIRGKSKAHAHRVNDSRISDVPIVSIDYMFMHKRQKGEEEKGMPHLVMKDRQSKTIKACTVPAKGVNDYAVRRLVKSIGELGYKKIILKSDQEPAMNQLVEDAGRLRAEKCCSTARWATDFFSGLAS